MEEIKDLRNRTKLSQREFSEKFGIPLRTIQKWEQNDSNPLPYLISLIQDEISLEEYLDMTRFLIPKENKFKSVISAKYRNINKIHPIQQERINQIINELKKYEEVKRIIVFGSSTTYKCNYDSDIDLYVELSKDINVKTYKVDCSVDYWTNYSVEPSMLNEIKKTGVIVYDR